MTAVGDACACGGVLSGGLRYEAERTVPVAICWNCGAEFPPFCARKPASSKRQADVTCPICGAVFYPRLIAPGRRQTTCSQPCRASALRGSVYRKRMAS